MTSNMTPALRMTALIQRDGETIGAVIGLVGLGAPYEAHASAPVRHDRVPTETSLASELAMARAVNDLHHQMMKRIHERIDRSVDDI